MPRHDRPHDRSGDARRHSHGQRDSHRRRSRSPERPTPERRRKRHRDRSEDPGDRSHERAARRRQQRSPPPHRTQRDKPTVVEKLKDEEEEEDERARRKELPFGARRLTRGDLQRFEPVLAHYLELQKQRCMDDMDDREVRGRWKRFMGKWNRGELAEGWYDPDMYERIVTSYPPETSEAQGGTPADDVVDDAGLASESESESVKDREKKKRNDEDDDDEDYGPTLPGGGAEGSSSSSSRRRPAGASIPTRDDLAARDEMLTEEKEAGRATLRAERQAERRLERERLEELVPRADAGTRERRLEKKREAADRMRQSSPGGTATAGVDDRELMGGDDSVAELKHRRDQERRLRTAREIRREEMARVRMAEMEEKRRKWEERERGTMSMLKEIARQRFGGEG